MSGIPSIETCKNLVEQRVYFPEKDEIDSLVPQIPTISSETNEIFRAIVYKPYEKYPEAPNLSQKFLQLQGSLKEFEEAKRSTGNDSSSSICLFVTYVAAALALGKFGFSTPVIMVAPLLPAIGVGIYMDNQNKNSQDREIEHKRKMVKISQDHAREATCNFTIFFRGKGLVERLKGDITKVINVEEEGSTRRKIYERALKELESCRDFCTVYSDEHKEIIEG